MDGCYKEVKCGCTWNDRDYVFGDWLLLTSNTCSCDATDNLHTIKATVLSGFVNHQDHQQAT